MGIVYSGRAPDGQHFIGFTTNSLQQRINNYRYVSENLLNKQSKLFSAIREQGLENFTWEVLVESYDRDYLLEQQEHFIEAYNSRDNGLNSTLGGRTGAGYCEEALERMAIPKRGKVASEETRRKMTVSRTGKKFSPETCAKIGDIHRGIKKGPMPQEHKNKIGAGNRGKKVADTSRMRDGALRRWAKVNADPELKRKDKEKRSLYQRKWRAEKRSVQATIDHHEDLSNAF